MKRIHDFIIKCQRRSKNKQPYAHIYKLKFEFNLLANKQPSPFVIFFFFFSSRIDHHTDSTAPWITVTPENLKRAENMTSTYEPMFRFFRSRSVQ